MAPFFGEGRVGPLAEPGLLLAPPQALGDEDLPDPAALHGDAPLLGQVRRQPVQRPTAEGQPQLVRGGQAGGDDFADLRRGVGRGPPGALFVLQPGQPPPVETLEPLAHGPVAQPHLGHDLGHSPPAVRQPADARPVAHPGLGRLAAGQDPQRAGFLLGHGTQHQGFGHGAPSSGTGTIPAS